MQYAVKLYFDNSTEKTFKFSQINYWLTALNL